MSMSLSSVKAAVNSLKQCQMDIGVGMDILTDVATDLAEADTGEDKSGIKKLEDMILECAKLDREINYFVDTVEQVTKADEQPPEAIFRLSATVREQFTEKINNLPDNDLRHHVKVAAFKECISRVLNVPAEETDEDVDVAVTQSEVNLTCPLTQVEMVKPMKNKKCNHIYDEEAILSLIKKRHSQKKKCRCPVVGCGNADVKESDLILDEALRRRIQNKNKR